ncbi:FMN-binding negative transcriptional regulator [Mucilaginibacter limnophilus]|uniref:FMN-binding negative transcriptional regulator n=1 Tax=Mucilaginibacter limnophilus TaxID=1932778 RepID=A0A437MT70_9SPHI|nr:FMN-binding negative transcriptional regulator [Mucilaginibacter limnophilus]RVU00849.1 FMN-binding negative transcriptional regulator [Mucilaginibacter limnophilus]
MYTPNHYKIADEAEAISFMQRYSFATIVTVIDKVPEATHLPFLIEKRDDKIILSSHLARANSMAHTIEQGTVLVIFAEPHAYISPSHYEKETEVPTWNYIAIHAYGKATVLSCDDDKLKLLEHTINTYEAGYLQQWNNLPDKFRNGLIQGITAFEIEVTDLQGKKKLSQNKTDFEKENIINSLQQSPVTTERDIATYMKREM